MENNQGDKIPTTPSELDARTVLDLGDLDIGEEVWIPVSPIRGDKFRAMKIVIKDRVSVNNYEEFHGIKGNKWPESDREPTSHQYSDGDARSAEDK